MITESGESGGGVVSAVSNGSNDRIATFTSSDALNGEANLTFNSNTLTINAGIVNKRNAVTSTMTASVSDYIIGVSASSAITIQLPNAATLGNGQTYVIKDEAGNASSWAIQVKAHAAQTIDGQASVYLESPYSSINLYCNGTDKFFIF